MQQPENCCHDSTFQSAQQALHHVFLFVNPTSGGNEAGKLLKAGVDEVKLETPEFVCLVRFHDIRTGTEASKPGFVQLKELISSNTYVQCDCRCVVFL